MTLEDAIRSVIGSEAPDDDVFAVARSLLAKGVREPMPDTIKAAADTAGIPVTLGGE
jgi:hypothetical protein